MRYDLPDMGDPPPVAAEVIGAPTLLPLAEIDEDPDQPRTEFDAKALDELAATIAARGVRQPVSVRRHPNQPQRWILNFGARRLRASKLAGKVEIPAFVDAALDSYDQVIENEQREALKPLELALFMQRRLALGETRADIARGLGKSRGYLTFIGALIDPPGWLLALYRSGKCTAINELYELRRLHETHQLAVEQWSCRQERISRDDVHRLKEAIGAESIAAEPPRSGAPDYMPAEDGSGDCPGALAPLSTSPAPVPAQPSRAAGAVVLWARYHGGEVTIDLRSAPAEEGAVFVRQSAGGPSICVNANDLQLVRATASRN